MIGSRRAVAADTVAEAVVALHGEGPVRVFAGECRESWIASMAMVHGPGTRVTIKETRRQVAGEQGLRPAPTNRRRHRTASRSRRSPGPGASAVKARRRCEVRADGADGLAARFGEIRLKVERADGRRCPALQRFPGRTAFAAAVVVALEDLRVFSAGIEGSAGLALRFPVPRRRSGSPASGA